MMTNSKPATVTEAETEAEAEEIVPTTKASTPNTRSNQTTTTTTTTTHSKRKISTVDEETRVLLQQVQNSDTIVENDSNNYTVNDGEYEDLLHFVDDIRLLDTAAGNDHDDDNYNGSMDDDDFENLLNDDFVDDNDGDDFTDEYFNKKEEEELNQYIEMNAFPAVATTATTGTMSVSASPVSPGTKIIVSRSSSIGSWNNKRNDGLAQDKRLYPYCNDGTTTTVSSSETSIATSTATEPNNNSIPDDGAATAKVTAENEESAERQSLPIITYRPSIPLYLTCDDTIMTPYQCYIRKQIELFETTCLVDDNSRDIPPDIIAGSNATIQGRNKPIVLGQVGVRCKFCYPYQILLPGTTVQQQQAKPNSTSSSSSTTTTSRGSMYYPSKLDGIYQAVNNIVNIHYLQNYCKAIPQDVYDTIVQLKGPNSNNNGDTNQPSIQPVSATATAKSNPTTVGTENAKPSRPTTTTTTTVTKGAGKIQWAQRAAALGVYEDATNNILRFYPTVSYVHDHNLFPYKH